MQKQISIILEQAKTAALKSHEAYGKDNTQHIIEQARMDALKGLLESYANSWCIEIETSSEAHEAWKELNEYVNDLKAIKA